MVVKITRVAMLFAVLSAAAAGCRFASGKSGAAPAEPAAEPATPEAG